jgi:hypothetical protein
MCSRYAEPTKTAHFFSWPAPRQLDRRHQSRVVSAPHQVANASVRPLRFLSVARGHMDGFPHAVFSFWLLVIMDCRHEISNDRHSSYALLDGHTSLMHMLLVSSKQRVHRENCCTTVRECRCWDDCCNAAHCSASPPTMPRMTVSATRK